MARKEIKSEGKDVSAAIIRGLKELGLRRDQAEVTVIQEEKSGFLGIGGKPAIVHVTEKRWTSEYARSKTMRDKSPYMDEKGPRKKYSPSSSPAAAKNTNKKRNLTQIRSVKLAQKSETQLLPSLEIQSAQFPEGLYGAAEQAKENLSKILELMGVKAQNISVWWDAKQERVLLTFDSDNPAIIVGKTGKTLESIQYLITLIISRAFDNPVSVIADTQNYWRKMEDEIDAEISRAISVVKRTKRPYKFRPMPAHVRRYLHKYFADNPVMSTLSEGEGKWRKVVLRFQKKDAQTERGPQQVVARSKADLTPIVWDNLPQDTAAKEGENAAHNSADSSDKSAAQSADNAGQSCVLTAETASCKDVANARPVAPSETAVEAEDKTDVPAHTNTGGGVAQK